MKANNKRGLTVRNELYSDTKQFFNTDVRAITILERSFPNTFSLKRTMLFQYKTTPIGEQKMLEKVAIKK